MEERTRRILETAVELAEEGGFEAVRMRDVAQHAGVALGTFYKRFRSKEDLLVAALELEAERLEKRVGQKPIQGDSPLDRVTTFFAAATTALTKKPNLAKAVLRAVASGDPELSEKVANFHGGITRMILAAIHGIAPEDEQIPGDLSSPELHVAFILQQVWFAALVGWSSGLHPKSAVADQMRTAAELLLAGLAGVQAKDKVA